MPRKPRTHVYIDGFNFYYGVVKGTPFKWLNLQSLCQRLLPKDDVQRIEYFTARVRPKPGDPDCHLRQGTYLEALRTLTDFEVVEGTFSVRPKVMPLLNATQIHPSPTDMAYPKVYVLKSEEKGSDVSLGARLVFEGCRQEYEVAGVMSNDSDLLEPIRLVRQELGLQVVVIMPATRRTQRFRSMRSVFDGHVDDIVPVINDSALRACQFPGQVAGPRGPVSKPATW